MTNYLCPLHGSTDGTALHGRHVSVFPAPARCLSWVPLCGGAEAAGEPRTEGKSLLPAPSIGRGRSLFHANSGSQAAAPGECPSGWISPGAGAAARNRGFNTLVALHVCGEVAASWVCSSLGKEHVLQGGNPLTNQVVTIPRSWIQGQVLFTVTDRTREPSWLLNILRNSTQQSPRPL